MSLCVCVLCVSCALLERFGILMHLVITFSLEPKNMSHFWYVRDQLRKLLGLRFCRLISAGANDMGAEDKEQQNSHRTTKEARDAVARDA